MKTMIAVAVLTIGLLAGGMAGNVSAGEAETSMWPGISGDSEHRGSSGDPWFLQDPIETGAFPHESDRSGESKRFVSGKDAYPVVEIGGIRYRGGLDTGP